MVNAPGLRFGIAYGAVVNVIFEVTFVRYVKHGITARVGVEVHGDARVEGLAMHSRAGVNFASRSK